MALILTDVTVCAGGVPRTLAAMGQGRDVYRNYTYVAFGLGIDALVVLVAVVDHSPWLAVVLAPLLVFGVRWAMVRVVVDGRGVRVVNLWRTHRLSWREVDSLGSTSTTEAAGMAWAAAAPFWAW